MGFVDNAYFLWYSIYVVKRKNDFFVNGISVIVLQIISLLKINEVYHRMKIGFIGLGAIGYPIFRRIIERFPVDFYARKQDVVDKAIEDGGIVAESISALAEKCDTIFVFVNTFEQCKDCFNQIAEGAKKEVTVVIGSTVSPVEIEELCRKGKQLGISVVDAPVTGGVKGAIEGTLTTMISGSAKIYEEIRPVLDAYSKKIVYVDEKPGQAEVLKALVQLLVGINSVAMSEAMTLGVKAGLAPEMIYDTITASAGTSRIFENRGEKVMDRDFNKRGTINIINKDLTICSQLAFDKKAPLFLGAITKQMFQIAASENDPLEDFNAVVKVYENMAGVTIERKNK